MHIEYIQGRSQKKKSSEAVHHCKNLLINIHETCKSAHCEHG